MKITKMFSSIDHVWHMKWTEIKTNIIIKFLKTNKISWPSYDDKSIYS